MITPVLTTCQEMDSEQNRIGLSSIAFEWFDDRTHSKRDVRLPNSIGRLVFDWVRLNFGSNLFDWIHRAGIHSMKNFEFLIPRRTNSEGKLIVLCPFNI